MWEVFPSKVEMVRRKYVTVTEKELFTPGREAGGARHSLAQVRNSSSESHLLKTVASGGPWHSEEQGEEALLTRFLPWAKSPPK